MSQNLTVKTVHGIKWSLVSTVATNVMQIGYTAIMARLLDPAAFGLVALAGVILRFGNYFANMGMAQAIIQKKEITEENIRVAFTSFVLLGVAFTGAFWILAPFASSLFNNTSLVPVVRAMAFSTLIGGLGSTASSLLRRNLAFKQIALTEIISYILAYGGVGVFCAYQNYGVWSLVYASLSQALIGTILSYLFARHSVKMLFEWQYYKPLFAFGSRVSLISFLEFLGFNLDTILIGRLLGNTSLGIYNRAYMLVNLPMQSLTTSFSKVLFPAFSKIQGETERLRNVYLSSISLVGYLTIPTCVGISVAAEEIVMVMLGEKWRAAVPVLQILALATPFNLLSHFGGIVCEATANLTVKVKLQLAYFAILWTLFFVLSRYGASGFALAILIAVSIRNLAYVFVTRSILQFSGSEIVGAYLPNALTALLTGAGIYAAKAALGAAHVQLPPLFLLCVEVCTGAICMIGLLLVGFNRNIRMQIANRLEKSLGNNSQSLSNRVVGRFVRLLAVR